MKVSIKTEQAMKACGQSVYQAAQALSENQLLIFLVGDLGAGKTTWVQGFIEAMGVTDPITSPTYTLVESYETTTAMAHHFDLYRLEAPEDLEDIGIRDYFESPCFCFVEWPEKAGHMLPAADLRITLEISDHERVLDIAAAGPTGARLLAYLKKGKHS